VPWSTNPGYTLARCLRDKADQVFTFTRKLTVPWTDDTAEQTLKSPKRQQTVSGYWHILDYPSSSTVAAAPVLISARSHGVRPTDAIQAALIGNPVAPTISTAGERPGEGWIGSL
jgi:transposase